MFGRRFTCVGNKKNLQYLSGHCKGCECFRSCHRDVNISGFFHSVEFSDGKRNPSIFEAAFENRLGGLSSDWCSSIDRSQMTVIT